MRVFSRVALAFDLDLDLAFDLCCGETETGTGNLTHKTGMGPVQHPLDSFIFYDFL